MADKSSNMRTSNAGGSKKRTNRRLKRSIRKTCGVLTLIMALIIASIPTPQAEAVGTDSTATAAADIAYNDATHPVTDESSIESLIKPAGATEYSALVIYQTSAGRYELWDVYSFWLKSVGSSTGQAGVIDKYNSVFTPQNGTLSISSEVVTNYPKFTSDQVTAFFSSTSTTGQTALTDAELEYYYKTEWDTYVAAKAAYDDAKAKYDAWVAAGSIGTAPVVPTVPVKPSYTAAQLSFDNQLEYFCNHESSLYEIFNKNYSLMEIVDKTTGASTGSGGTVGNVVAYIPYNSSNAVASDPASGFYAPTTDHYSIKYIGDDAFAGAANIQKLDISKDIIQIGNAAFEGAAGIQEITAYSGVIGNRAFKGCSSLRNIVIQSGTQIIGTECFYGCNTLQSITLPATIQKIGKGAFAFDASLKTVDMSGITANLMIDQYAFYDCYSLNTVSFSEMTQEIQYAAFAVQSGITGSWKEIVFPSQVATLGDYVLAGRSNLRTVTMPASYGLQNDVTLGAGFFKGCINLQHVDFPDTGTGSCGKVSFPTNAFYDVLSADFYIRGPEIDSNGNISAPRKSAWAAGITFAYEDATGDHWEVGSGIYRFAVDENGILTSCVLIDDAAKTKFTDVTGNNGEVEIPAKIGEIVVTGIAADCFSYTTDPYIHDNMKTLKICDGSEIKSIAAGAFQSFPKLAAVYIGNSVNSIGDSAFADCGNLEAVVFSTPLNGYSGFTIGTDAFATGSSALTFYGDIVQGYAPFEWAMNENNYMDAVNQKRVCYKSGTPEYPNLTVILNNDNNEITLVDYPHYDELSDNIRTRYEKYLSGAYTSNDEIALTASETTQLDRVLNINIPAGIESIDVKSFMSSTKNSYDVASYMTTGEQYNSTYRQNGLFSGYYGTHSDTGGTREYESGNTHELVAQGNDRILSVTMNTVKKLPDGAFYSCENLSSVILGSALTDIGTAPFSGCDRLTSVGGNDTYTCANGIIYENNATGKTIIECLSSRGNGVGSSYIDVTTDPDIAGVTEIAKGAFENCTSIMSVDLTSAAGLTTIPENCFSGDSNLITVMLSDSINAVNKGAFTDTRKYISVTIPAKEVAISTSAFDDTAILRSYEGSAVETYALMNGHQFQAINKSYAVYFMDYDGKQLDLQYVEEGKAAVEPKTPTRPDGYTFSAWSTSFTNITKDTIVVAVYKAPATASGTPTPTPTKTTGTPTPTGKGTTGTPTPTGQAAQHKLTVTGGTGGGTYATGATVIITANTPTSGQVFTNWTSTSTDFNIANAAASITTITMPSHDLTMTANFVTATPTPTGSAVDNGTTGSNGTNGSSGTNGNASATVSGSTTGTGGTGTEGSSVTITKPGISNTGVASATVDGSTDNYIVKISDTEESRAAVEAALTNEYGSLDDIRYFAMDISLYDSTGTTKIADTTGLSVTITMPLPDDLVGYAGNNQVAGVVNGYVLDKLKPKFTTIDGIACVTFTATHFSPYTIYVDTTNLSAGVADSTPQTGDLVHPKWFLVVALVCTSMVLLLKKDKRKVAVKTA